jgi:hypothetical protein
MLDLNSIKYLQTVGGLEALYEDAATASVRKVVDGSRQYIGSGDHWLAFAF